MLMIIHEALPAHAADFAKTPMPPAGTLTAVEVGLGLGARRESGPLMMDTGGSGTLTVNAAFAQAHGLSGTMRKLGTSQMGGVGPAVIQQDVVLLPELSLAGQTLRNVPITVERPGQGTVASAGDALFMEVLSRFNVLFDYPHNEAYFRPNARFADPFRLPPAGPPWYAKAALAVFAVAASVGLALWFLKRRDKVPG
jgi:hypothetical protein